MNRTWIGLIGFVLLIGVGGTLSAETVGSDLEFQMYSWPRGTKWDFAVFEGSVPIRQLERIQAPNQRMNLDKLKGRIAGLPTGSKLHWQVDQRRGLVLPPHELIYDVNRFANTAGVFLLLPGQTRDDKALEDMQHDAQPFKENAY